MKKLCQEKFSSPLSDNPVSPPAKWIRFSFNFLSLAFLGLKQPLSKINHIPVKILCWEKFPSPLTDDPVSSLLISYSNPTREMPDSSPDLELPVWSPFTIPELNYLEIRLNNSTTERAVQASGMAFWNRYIPELRMFLGIEDNKLLSFRLYHTYCTGNIK